MKNDLVRMPLNSIRKKITILKETISDESTEVTIFAYRGYDLVEFKFEMQSSSVESASRTLLGHLDKVGKIFYLGNKLGTWNRNLGEL